MSANGKASSTSVSIAAIAVIVAALYFAKSVLIPLTLAVLLSFLLAPVCDWLERLKLGRIPAVVTTALLTFLLLGLVGWTVAVQMADLAEKLPSYQGNIETKLRSLNDYVKGTLSRITQTGEQIGEKLAESNEEIEESRAARRGERSYLVRMDQPPVSPLVVVGRLVGSLLELVGTAGIVVVFIIFFLVRREDLRDRMIRLISQGRLTVTTQALNDAGQRVSRYLLTQLTLNAIYGAPVAVGLSLLGIPNAVLWGLLAMVLRFIPYVGPWIAASIPISLSFAISPGWVIPLLTVNLFIVLELLSNNVLEPWLYGRRTGVSPAAVLVAAVFWTWLWGGAGLLLATPLTVCLVVIGKHVPQLSFLSILLGDEPVFEPPVRVYQRLLAGDQEEALELIEDRLKTESVAEIYDNLLVPALALAERDRHRGEMDRRTQECVIQGFKEIIEDLGDWELHAAAQAASDAAEGSHERSPIAPATPRPACCVLCVPARDEADEVAATMLAQILRNRGFDAEAVSEKALASEILDIVAMREADMVCISAMPPAAATHARYLSKRLRARFPHVNQVIGLWNTSENLNKSRERLGAGDSIRVVRTFAEANDHVEQLSTLPVVRATSRKEILA